MFIVNLTYIKPLDEVEKHLEKHIDFLNQYYTKGLFIASGRKNPRTGGIILMRAKNKEAVQEIPIISKCKERNRVKTKNQEMPLIDDFVSCLFLDFVFYLYLCDRK